LTNKELLETTKDIVISMVNSKLLTANSKNEVNNEVKNAIEEIYDKLVELNSKPVTIGKSSYSH
jgi:hypothetical protein